MGGPYTKNAKGCELANFNPLAIEYQDLHNGEYNYPNDDYTISAIRDGIQFLGKSDIYWPNESGNAAEMVAEKGITKGGSWNSLPQFIHNVAVESYNKPNSQTGFRVVMEKVKVYNSIFKSIKFQTVSPSGFI